MVTLREIRFVTTKRHSGQDHQYRDSQSEKLEPTTGFEPVTC